MGLDTPNYEESLRFGRMLQSRGCLLSAAYWRKQADAIALLKELRAIVNDAAVDDSQVYVIFGNLQLVDEIQQ